MLVLVAHTRPHGRVLMNQLTSQSMTVLMCCVDGVEAMLMRLIRISPVVETMNQARCV